MAPGLRRPASSSDPISNSFSSPGARRRPSSYSGKRRGAWGPVAEFRNRLPAGPCGAGASSGLLASPLGGSRGERLPPAEMRAETRGTSRTLDLQPPPPSKGNAQSRRGLGVLCPGCSRPCAPRGGALRSARPKLFSVARSVSSPAALSAVLYFNHSSESPHTSPFLCATTSHPVPSSSSLSRAPLLVLTTPPASYPKLLLELFGTY